MYKSPIEIIVADIHTQMVKQQEKDIYEAVQSYGISVDKDELVRALEYDRRQYTKGYIDGVIEFANYLKDQFFSYDPDNEFNFQTIDADNLDDYVEEFLEVRQ